MSTRMPAVFFGHGNPMNALMRNSYTEQWSGMGARLPRPKAILCISARWYIPNSAVTVSTSNGGPHYPHLDGSPAAP